MSITQHWQDHIEAWRSSGLTQAGYCRQYALNYKTFAARLSEYRCRQEVEKSALIPVTVAKESVEPQAEQQPFVLTLRQGHQLELPGTVSAEWLSLLLRGLL